MESAMNKIYLPLLIFFISCCCAFGFWKQTKENQQLKALLEQSSSQLTSMNLSLGRALTKEGEAKLLVDKLSKSLRKEIKAQEESIALVADIEAELQVERKKQKVVTKVEYRDRDIVHEIPLPKDVLFLKTQEGDYQEVNSLKYNYKDFRIEIKGDAIKGELSYKLSQRFRAVLTQTNLLSGKKNHYIEIFEQDDKGKDIQKLELKNFKVVISSPPEKQFHWFNPKVDIGINGGLSFSLDPKWQLDVGISFLSYGRTKNDLDWRFLRIGLGYDGSDVLGSFSPVQYRLNLPLFSNTWAFPFVSSSRVFGAGIAVIL
jgi:hypothetical protein